MGEGAPEAPNSWALTAKLSPSDGDGDDDRIDKTEVIPPEWSNASEAVRTTVKWMVGALGAIGAVLFAKGLISTPNLNWTDDRTNLVAAWFLGGVGLIGLGWLIYEAVQVLTPSIYELGGLPPAYIAAINEDPPLYLPGGVKDFAEFITGYRRLREKQAEWQGKVTEAKFEAKRAQAAKPPNEAVKAAATEKLALAEEVLGRFETTLAVYVKLRKELVDRATFWSAAQGFATADARMITAAAIAAFGGIGYQLVLAPARPDAANEATATPARVAQLSQTDTPAAEELWALMNLAPCQADPDTAVITVVVSSGNGSADDPWVVETIPEGDCLPRSFTVISDVALVSEATTTTITYSPAPSPPASPSG